MAGVATEPQSVPGLILQYARQCTRADRSALFVVDPGALPPPSPAVYRPRGTSLPYVCRIHGGGGGPGGRGEPLQKPTLLTPRVLVRPSPPFSIWPPTPPPPPPGRVQRPPIGNETTLGLFDCIKVCFTKTPQRSSHAHSCHYSLCISNV